MQIDGGAGVDVAADVWVQARLHLPAPYNTQHKPQIPNVYSLVRLVWQNTEELISLPFAGLYDELWASVMKAVPKLDESESGQMVLK